MVDYEKLIKNLLSQFCDKNFKYSLNMKILGSLHVVVDNNEVVTCLLNEKFFKSPLLRGFIPNGGGSGGYSPQSNNSATSPNQTAPALPNAADAFTILTQITQQRKLIAAASANTLIPNVKIPNSSSSSCSSTSSSSSASTYASSDQISNGIGLDLLQQASIQVQSAKHKRKRFSTAGMYKFRLNNRF